ncbi:ESF1 family protein [Lentzea nigeriaca]|uniref:hypothetical protein n=1 Tax=Lentzea nigeriaca TaxID=1128665 RepID=UPI001957CD87|nr:hypothetical protein [Lentzea nigeriaca]MBM7856256.1 tetratricopeptide (TPR) repeat protein [Lentzea nigeriaca]
MTATVTEDTRTRLLAAIEDLRAREATPAVRIALAEAEFRLAIDAATEPAEAIERLRAAIEQDPFSPKLFLHLGRVLHLGGNPIAALPEYRHAIRLAPGSRRAHLLLGLALLDMGQPTRELGNRMVAALNEGGPADLQAAVAEIDTWVEEQSAPAADRKSRKSALKAAAPDAWRIALYEQITCGGKTQASQLSVLLRTGQARVADADEVAEYATACVLMLAAGQPPKAVRDFAKPVLTTRAGHPAVVLLTAALELAEAGDPAAFVAMASERLEHGVLPLELVCWLHFTAYGPHRSGRAVDALALLESYPRRFRDTDSFDELRLAVLDGHARNAWSAERFDEARFLWQEAGSIDRFRVPVALNLALLAARTRSTQDYGPAWERLSELLYLHAAGAGDVQLLLDERRTLHLALAQQARQRHCESSGPRDTPAEAEIEAWLADEDALTEWLHQWDLHYVNARLGFRSPAHLLGVLDDAGEEDRAAAATAFARHVELALGGRDWAGVAVFADLAAAVAQQAHQSITETRDEYYEPERAAARALAEVALNRGLTLRRMMMALRDAPSGAQLRLGYDLARRQLALPWQVLRPICVELGLLGEDVDPVKLFEYDLVSLATFWDQPEAPAGQESILDGCVKLVPHDLTLRLMHCRALRAAERPADAYTAAVAALELPSSDDERREVLLARLVDEVDIVGWEDIPESIRTTAGPPPSMSAEDVIAVIRQALQRFPRSAVVRRELVRQLVRTDRVTELTEAIDLLREGITQALNAEQREEFAKSLTEIAPKAASAPIRAAIRELVEPAQQAARTAIDDYMQNGSPERKKAALTAVRSAIGPITEGRRMAEQAGLDAELSALDESLAQLNRLAEQLGDAEPQDGEG